MPASLWLECGMDGMVPKLCSSTVLVEDIAKASESNNKEG